MKGSKILCGNEVECTSSNPLYASIQCSIWQQRKMLFSSHWTCDYVPQSNALKQQLSCLADYHTEQVFRRTLFVADSVVMSGHATRLASWHTATCYKSVHSSPLSRVDLLGKNTLVHNWNAIIHDSVRLLLLLLSYGTMRPHQRCWKPQQPRTTTHFYGVYSNQDWYILFDRVQQYNKRRESEWVSGVAFLQTISLFIRRWHTFVIVCCCCCLPPLLGHLKTRWLRRRGIFTARRRFT